MSITKEDIIHEIHLTTENYKLGFVDENLNLRTDIQTNIILDYIVGAYKRIEELESANKALKVELDFK